ncbi:MAG: hypothetical protein M1828_006790 [Chrysothrix sp. TS-e1954]|nr:MAG: hypothetical protein M1828_006790 [Chrysothrix sp. TS-e1954]
MDGTANTATYAPRSPDLSASNIYPTDTYPVKPTLQAPYQQGSTPCQRYDHLHRNFALPTSASHASIPIDSPYAISPHARNGFQQPTGANSALQGPSYSSSPRSHEDVSYSNNSSTRLPGPPSQGLVFSDAMAPPMHQVSRTLPPGEAEGIIVRTKFPVARIKRIVQADEDVSKVAQVTPVVVSKALELFMISLALRSAAEARARGTKRITAAHLKEAVAKDEHFDFLSEIVAKIPDAPAGKDKSSKTKDESNDEDDEPMQYEASKPAKKKRGPSTRKR